MSKKEQSFTTNTDNNIATMFNGSPLSFKQLLNRLERGESFEIRKLSPASIDAKTKLDEKTGKISHEIVESGSNYTQSTIESTLLSQVQTFGTQNGFEFKFEIVNYIAVNNLETLNNEMSIGMTDLRKRVNDYFKALRNAKIIAFENDAITDEQCYELLQAFCRSYQSLGLKHKPLEKEDREAAKTKLAQLKKQQIERDNALIAKIEKRLTAKMKKQTNAKG